MNLLYKCITKYYPHRILIGKNIFFKLKAKKKIKKVENNIYYNIKEKYQIEYKNIS